MASDPERETSESGTPRVDKREAMKTKKTLAFLFKHSFVALLSLRVKFKHVGTK